MRSGPLRHRITLQTQTQTRSATGAFTRTWTDSTTVWADILPATGREQWTADTQTSDLPLRVIKDRLDSGEIDPTSEIPRPRGIRPPVLAREKIGSITDLPIRAYPLVVTDARALHQAH